MKRKMFKKVMAASLATAMTVSSLAGCGSTAEESTVAEDTTTATETTTDTQAATETATETVEEVAEEEDDAWTPLTDENGNVYDLGGMEIIIRDWWSGDPSEPTNGYEEAQQEWRDWIQETYNFTIKSQAISDWGSAPADFVEYATTGGDENYAFVLRDDPAVTSAMASGLMYDLSTLDCLDFTKPQYAKNKLHEQYSSGDSIYCMYAGDPEPRGGIYFNKRLLTEAGIDPESIYDLQANHEWTWDKFEELMAQVQRDTNNDGVIDVYGMTLNNGNLVSYLVWSNGGEYVGKEDGKFVYKLENSETVEALEEAVKLFDNYLYPQPEDAQWDAYKETFKAGLAAFMPEDAYAGTKGNFLYDMEDDYGFVCVPMGPNMTDYVDCFSNNPVAIPACYDEEKAWNIAFAYDLYNAPVPGYEDYEGWKSTYYDGFRDTRAVDETMEILRDNGIITYHGVIPSLSLGSDLVWNIGPGAVVSEQIEAIADTWKEYIRIANGE